ncbi:hypothetical protein LCGC14_1585950 [marine sediment metagenome]|uniref:Uncharacterized protein n=1 Tax=marine sediment metagenome TaxID=412755 RepID=A0A0F9LFR3_9ZZZZ
MMDVALLTDKGIVFCRIPSETLDRFRQLALDTKPGEVAMAYIETTDDVTYEVRCRDILVKFVAGR